MSTSCRYGDHRDCQDHPVVRCDCPCHVARADLDAPAAQPAEPRS